MAAAILVVLLSWIVSCSGAPERAPAKPLVLVSLRPQQWFVRQISGDLVDVEAMIPPGADPESFEPSFSHLRSFSRASAYLSCGPSQLPFERDWLPKLQSQMPQLKIIDGSRGMELRPGDPHLWLSPRWGLAMAEAATAALSELLPGERARFERNHAQLQAELRAMEQEIRELFERERVAALASFHPTWSYFAEHFGLVQIAIEEEGKEPDPASLGKRLSAIEGHKLTVLFVDPYGSGQEAKAVAAEAGLELEVVDPLAYEWANNLREFAARLAKKS